jgi:DNA integrity scanning protein DisA with diadenylate cyclase activity
MTSMTRAEALAGMVGMILDQMPAAQRDEIMQSPKLIMEVVKEVEQLVQETGDAAKLNNMSLDEFMKAYGRGLDGQKGHA